ncbi:methionine gamma-lyase [Mycoplasma putrefaciens]|uniref:L-methionine gamma-lyase n=2 Tax=Mycoplasma putrefaciens TaxID=2123 RepID=M9WCJ7_9MOLU|nr:methionine gamma-lyase [Mycoplasma putrefaciens]AEM68680.1 methionine gamma-lyase [Mycoplasma putrefaciens KS1]AGJ90857.1 Methionine gamma-lyase [Mycoplasma putrefaciens Mput9231]
MNKKGFSTRAIHQGKIENKYRALATPIYQTSTFIFDSAEQGGNRFAGIEEGYIYSRLANPSVSVIEKKIALLEGAQAAVATSSGMGAITSLIWSQLKAGDHIVAAKTLYGCTFALLKHGITKYGVTVDFVDSRDVQNIQKALKPNTKMVYLESPANPNMYLTDIKAAAKVAHTIKDCLLVVDSTYCTPYIQRPIELGADVVVHSATKYLNGHGDVIAGFVVANQEIIDQVRMVGIKDMTGSVLGAFEAFLLERGMKTLEIRMKAHCENALKVAEFLESHPAVSNVLYPGLKSFPQYQLAQQQMDLPGAMISFELKNGREAGIKLMNSVKLCTLAVSLGDCETLIQHPASMTHSTYTAEQRQASDIAEGLVRLSVGLENYQDIIDDLKQALDKLI